MESSNESSVIANYCVPLYSVYFKYLSQNIKSITELLCILNPFD